MCLCSVYMFQSPDAPKELIFSSRFHGRLIVTLTSSKDVYFCANQNTEKKNIFHSFWEERHRKVSHECSGSSYSNSLEYSETSSINPQKPRSVWLHYIPYRAACEALMTPSVSQHTHLFCYSKAEICIKIFFFMAHSGQSHIPPPAPWPHVPLVDGCGFVQDVMKGPPCSMCHKCPMSRSDTQLTLVLQKQALEKHRSIWRATVSISQDQMLLEKAFPFAYWRTNSPC